MIAGLVLAAGAGTRFDSGFKLLAELDGRPLLEHAVRAACAVSALERVVVVLGSRASEVLAAVSFGRSEAVVCPEWADGQSASLRCGLRALGEGVEKVVVTLGDEPFVSPELIASFAFEPGGARAMYGGRPGHPVVLGPVQLAAVPGLSGDSGARSLLAGGRRIECGAASDALDVDTVADLERARGRVGRRLSGERSGPAMSGERSGPAMT